jgi:hypothetical protein
MKAHNDGRDPSNNYVTVNKDGLLPSCALQNKVLVIWFTVYKL